MMEAVASRRIAVAMSGGVDSTVAAYLLKERGYNVTGIFMQNWDEMEERGVCTVDGDYRKVQDVCHHLQIPCRRVNFIKEYWNEVFSSFLHDYKTLLTPNPDILCNRKIKFDILRRYVNNLGFDHLATGHYAQLHNTPDGTRLLQSVDINKDQTYFLSCVPGTALTNVLFPLGRLPKTKVKTIAEKIGLQWVAKQMESMGICFIGRRSINDFLQLYLEKHPGSIETIDGKVVGEHNGLFCYTIGQRVRLPGLQTKLYVAEKDEARNVVVVVPGWDHPVLYTSRFCANKVNWITSKLPWQLAQYGVLHCSVRVRHQQPLVDCTVQIDGSVIGDEDCGEAVVVKTGESIRAVTPGQVAAFYLQDECLGGAKITTRLISINSYYY